MTYFQQQKNILMITNDFTICKTSIELNITLEAQKINEVFLVIYWFENVNFKSLVRDIKQFFGSPHYSLE